MTKFIFFGRLVQEKGIGIILDVFTKLHEEGIGEWSLDIYGAGEFADHCDKFAHKLQAQVMFHGW